MFKFPVNLGKGLHPASTPETSSLTKQINIKLNEDLTKDSFRDVFKENWSNSKDFKTESLEFFNDPFKFCSIDNFMENVAALDKIRQEMNEIVWNKRQMDLYEFFQSNDLGNVDSVYIRRIYEFLNNDVRDWVRAILN